MAKKYELMTNTVWPSTKKAYNFFIFWPTYRKRLATPGLGYGLGYGNEYGYGLGYEYELGYGLRFGSNSPKNLS